jgi:hypothetical protein
MDNMRCRSKCLKYKKSVIGENNISDDADLMNKLIDIFGNENININDSRFMQFRKLFALMGNKKNIINY